MPGSHRPAVFGLDTVRRHGVLIALLVLVVAGAFLAPAFLTANNLLNIGRSVALVGLVAIGMTFVALAGSYADLSVPAVVGGVGILMLTLQPLITSGPAIVVALIVGLAIGVGNGVLIGVFRGNPIVITLATNIVILGAFDAIVQGEIVYDSDPGLQDVIQSSIAGIPVVVLIFLGVALTAHIVASRSVLGRWLYSTGGNRVAARASGIPVTTTTVSAFAASGLLAALAGVLLSTQLGTAQSYSGEGYEFDAIGAIVIGGTSLFGGSGSVARTVIGVLIIGVMNNLLTLLGVPTPNQGIIKGAVIILAVGGDLLVRNRRERSGR